MDFIMPVRVTVEIDMEVDGEIVEMDLTAAAAAEDVTNDWMAKILDGEFTDPDAELLTEMLTDATGFCVTSIWVGID